MNGPGDGDDFDEDFEDDEEDLDFLDEDEDDEDFDDEDFEDEDDDELRTSPEAPPGPSVPVAELFTPDPDDPDHAPGKRLSLGRPVLGSLEPFARESFELEEVTTPPGLLYEIRQFLGGAPIAYDPCSSPWSTTRATEHNMLQQYRAAQLKLSTETMQSMRYKHNFPGRVTFGDGLARPFPAEGLTYVFPGFKAGKTQQWLKKVRTESIQQRSDPDRPRVVQQGNELPFAGEVIMAVSLEHIAQPWFDYVWAADAVCFLRETLWWGGAEARSKVGTVLVYYGYRKGRFRRAFSGAGRVLRRKDIKYTGPRSLGLYAPAAEPEERLVKVQKASKPKPSKKTKKEQKT